MSVFDSEVEAAAAKMDKATIKGGEFEGGLTLQFKSVSREKSQYGAEADSSIVEKGILEEGEQFVFKFVDSEGDTRTHYSKSMPFFVGMKQVEFNEGDWLTIKRTGQKKDTRFTVEVVDGPKVSKKPKKDEIDADGIPF